MSFTTVPALLFYGSPADTLTGRGMPMTGRGLSRVCRAVGVALLALSGPSVAAALSAGAQDTATASVVGVVWQHDDSPLPNALVRLRNVVTGRVTATATADSVGRVVFTVERGTYILELITDAGHIQAVGHVFEVSPGQTVATFVRLPARAPRMAGLFSNAATAVLSTAAALGITAVGPGLQPLSPNR